MNSPKTLTTVLGLSVAEQTVFGNLDNSEHKTVAETAATCSLPRMTVHKILLRFFDRGLVQRIKRGKHFRYSKTSEVQLIKQLLPNSALPLGALPFPIKDEKAVTIYHGHQALTESYRKQLRDHNGHRVYAIELDDSLQAITANVPRKMVEETNKIISDSGVVLEVIVDDKFFDTLHESFDENFDEFLDDFLNRQAATTVLPAGAITLPSDLLIFKDIVLIADWHNEIAVEIKNSLVVEFFMSFFRLLQSQGETMSYHNLARKFRTQI